MGDESPSAEGNWRSVLEACSDGVAITEDGEFAFVGGEYAGSHGYDRAALDGRPWRVCYAGAGRERIERDALPAVAGTDGGEWRGTVRGRRRDGSTFRESLTLCRLDGERAAWLSRPIESEDRTTRPYRTLVESFPNGAVALFDTDLRYTVVDGRIFEEMDRDPGDMEGERLVDVHTESYTETYLDHYRAALAGEQRRFEFGFADRWFRAHIIPVRDESGTVVSGIAMTQDATELHERERALERRRDELATLDRISELLLETVRELIQTSSRDAVERTVCERLAASDLYRFAWVGERAFDGDRTVPRASAGEGHGYLDALAAESDGEGGVTGEGPWGRAIHTGEVQTAGVDGSSPAAWRELADACGFASVAAVPLSHGGTVYGVLTVYAARGDAFSEREQAGFGVLGRTVGLVVYAARSHELLFAETVVELAFDLAGTDLDTMDLAADLDCEITLEGYVRSGDRWIMYLGVDGAPPGAVVDAAAGTASIRRGRVIREDGEGGRIELIAVESRLLDTVTAAGATVRAAVARSGDGRLVVEAPADASVRRLVDLVRAEYPGAELVGRGEHDREVTTVGRPGGPLEELTDRQREAIETAYRAGYFAWPRKSTATEVAASLDIAPSTLHGHLRKAEGWLLAALLDGE